MYTVIFESQVPGILQICGKECHDMSCKTAVAKTDRSFAINFAPYGNMYESVCERVTLPHFTSCDVRLLQWDKCVFSVFINAAKKIYPRPLTCLAQAEWECGVATLCDDGSLYMLFESGGDMCVFPIDFRGESARLRAVDVGGIPMIHLTAEEGGKKFFGLYTVNNGFTAAYEGVGDEFHLDGDLLTRIKSCSNMSRAVIETRYVFDGKTFVRNSCRLVSSRNARLEKTPVPLRICAFLEGVSLGIDELARPYISEELGAFSASAAGGFFGNFIDIKKSPIHPEDNVVALLYDDCGTLSVRHFCFEIKNGRIANIRELGI